jgi:hypothetical protein
MLCFWYLVSLMVETRKHSLHFAATLSGFNPSQFSKFLRKHHGVAAYTLEDLSKKQAKQLAPVLTELEGLPWTVAILIDATLQTRAGLHTENAQRFNHGHGFVIGHQWTNIVLILNGILIPLPPIPFYSKNYCKKVLNIPYKTEHERLIAYLHDFTLEAYIGTYAPEKVVVIADSGYDDHAIQQTILNKHWQFLFALKSRRGVKSPAQYLKTRKSKGWTQIAQFFKNHRRLRWNTVDVPAPNTKNKRMEFRVRQTTGYLKGVGKVQLVCSEFKKRRNGRRKYLACSDLSVTPRHILIGYRLRWRIEIFHKQVKMHLGFEDVSPKYFRSVETHVYLVYCAYILLRMDLPGLPHDARTILEKQAYIKAILDKRTLARILQRLTQFGGVEKYMDELKAVLSGI